MGGDSISDNEEHTNDNFTAAQHRQRNVTKPPKKHFIHHNNQVIVEDIPNDMDFNKKYKTLDPTYKIRSHHMDSITNYNSLERGTRRRLPDVPTHSTPIHHGFNTQSLPRPPKHHHREQSDSRSRERYAECQLISKEFNSVWKLIQTLVKQAQMKFIGNWTSASNCTILISALSFQSFTYSLFSLHSCFVHSVWKLKIA